MQIQQQMKKTHEPSVLLCCQLHKARTCHHQTLSHRQDDRYFFTKPLGGAKFRWFQNITMNCDHGKYGPVDSNTLLVAQHQTIKACDVTDVNDDEPQQQKDSDRQGVGSQECVGKQTRHMGQPSAWPIKIK
jgi:hypothetical protein